MPTASPSRAGFDAPMRVEMSSRFTSRRLLIGISLVLVVLFESGVSSCLQTSGQRRAALRRAAEGLIPSEAHIRALGYGDCVELASGPSCAGAVFELPQRASMRRARAVRATAERHGWTVVKIDDAQGGWSLFLRRPGYTAYVVLWRPEVYGLSCDSPRPDDKCFNTLSLERSS
jgi:hypothetical protein